MNKFHNRSVKVIASNEKLRSYRVSRLIKQWGRYDVIGFYDLGNGNKGIRLNVDSKENCIKYEDVELLPLILTMEDISEKFGVDIDDIRISTR